ncbi:MAG TPA: hypothetical protein VKD91_23365 [Pyrinomonadaceae bacterium]|nr:hypothetical protein [Pyrinomonadaceae bacterium]
MAQEIMETRHQHFSDDAVRGFLLGQLSAAEQSRFEEQLFTDSDLEARVRLAEFELADDYAFKRLNEGENERFGERYLLTADRNQKLHVSTALRDRFVTAPTAEPEVGLYQRLRVLLDIRRPSWRYAFAVLVLMLLLATVFLVTKEPQIVRRFVPQRLQPRPHPTATPQLMNHSTAESSPAHPEQPSLQSPHEAPPIVSLSSSSAIDQAPVVALPRGENALVRFQPALNAEQTGVYRAEVLTTSGEIVFNVEPLKPYGTNPSSISCDVPASALKVGQYLIKLTRIDDQSKPVVFQYYFRVQ